MITIQALINRITYSLPRFLVPGYRPRLPGKVRSDRLIGELAAFFGKEKSAISAMWRDYTALASDKEHSKLMGEVKTLSLEEAFVMYVVFNIHPPKDIVEIGVQFGRSTRRIIDMKNALGITAPIVCIDIENKAKFFTPDEATLLIKDVTNTFKEEILDKYPQGGFMYLDAHPYGILKSVIDGIMDNGKWILTIHDCERGICNPHMTVGKEEQNITSHTGLWERYVLADAFGITDPLNSTLENTENTTHRLRIFSTPHGLALILPKSMTSTDRG